MLSGNAPDIRGVTVIRTRMLCNVCKKLFDVDIEVPENPTTEEIQSKIPKSICPKCITTACCSSLILKGEGYVADRKGEIVQKGGLIE